MCKSVHLNKTVNAPNPPLLTNTTLSIMPFRRQRTLMHRRVRQTRALCSANLGHSTTTVCTCRKAVVGRWRRTIRCANKSHVVICALRRDVETNTKHGLMSCSRIVMARSPRRSRTERGAVLYVGHWNSCGAPAFIRCPNGEHSQHGERRK